MPRLRILSRNTLQFIRKKTTGSYDDKGKWVGGEDKAPFKVKGSLQPFEQGKTRIDLPTGVTSSDVRLFYTDCELHTADEHSNQESDTTTIDGREFICYDKEDWKTPSINLPHFKVFLVRKDKLNGN